MLITGAHYDAICNNSNYDERVCVSGTITDRSCMSNGTSDVTIHCITANSGNNGFDKGLDTLEQRGKYGEPDCNKFREENINTGCVISNAGLQVCELESQRTALGATLATNSSTNAITPISFTRGKVCRHHSPGVTALSQKTHTLNNACCIRSPLCYDNEHLKFCVWNINGLTHHKLKKHILGKFLMNFDIILLSEPWSENKEDFKLDGFMYHDFFRKYKHSKAKRGYGGFGVFKRKELKRGVEIFRNHADIVVWLKIKKEYFSMESDIYI